ncbi:MAG: transcriptional activator RfaH [Rhizomicrobium sp.]
MDKVIATGARWYVVQTQPHAENRAIANLERQGFRIFCPRVRKTVRHARAVKHVFSPLFPGYVFLERDVAVEPWRSVNGTFGVIRLITQGEAPQPVPRGVVEALQSRMGGDGAMNWAPSFKIGQTIRITEGPFADLVGTLEQLDASGRVRVLLDLLGRSVSVALRHEALAPAA